MKRNTLIVLLTLMIGSTILSCSIFKKEKDASSALEGNWELNYISGARIAFNGLFPNEKPNISFDAAKGEVHGNTSCNGFTSKTTINGNKISISEPGPMTMRYCDGGGEKPFLDMLKKVTSYNVNGNTLTFIQGDIAVMRFTKK